jgi:DNA-binding protein H-NS
MAKSLSRIMIQIERLQKEAAAIQATVIDRVRKEIVQHGLTVEQLFGNAGPSGSSKRNKTAKSKSTAAKFADGAGNTWGGRGKRPDWLRQALAAGNALEDFLVGAPTVAAEPEPARRKPTTKRAASTKAGKVPARKTAARKAPAAKKETAAPVKKASAGRKARAKPAVARKRRAAAAPASEAAVG